MNSQLAALFLLVLLLSLGECFGVVEKFDKFNFENANNEKNPSSSSSSRRAF